MASESSSVTVVESSEIPSMPSRLRLYIGCAFGILLGTCTLVAIHEFTIGGPVRREFFIGHSSALFMGLATSEFVRRFVFNPPKETR